MTELATAMGASREPRVAPACAAVLAGLLATSAASLGQPAVYETEPNDTPAAATRVTGAVRLIGAMAPRDQDGWMWTVSDVDAQKRWTFELDGIPGELTVVDVLRVEVAENGVDVTEKKKLLTIGSRDGSRPAIVEDLLFEPGEYLLGVAHAGGGSGGAAGGSFRPPIGSLSFAADDSAGPAGGGGAGGAAAPPAGASGGSAGGYRLAIREGGRLLLDPSPKPHDARERAQSLRPGSEHGAFTAEKAAWYELRLGEKEAAESWEIAAQVPIGRTASAFLRDATGKELARTSTDARGQLAFRDLGLQAGTYLIDVQEGEGGLVLAVAARSIGQRVEGAEAEPNDAWNHANRADLSQPLTGRMGEAGESDYFSFALDETVADRLLTVALEAPAEALLRFCLLDGAGRPLQCRDRQGGVELVDLLLAPGEYGLLVGRGPEGTAYSVRLTAGGEPQPGVETEPNDSVELASAVPASNRVKGRSAGADDVDFYRVVVTEEPQLWRFQVMGDGIREVTYHDGSGIQSQRVRPAAGQRRVRLENLYLLPGEHTVSVAARGDGEYTLLAVPIGPPDPNGEREPNDDRSRMQPLAIGQTRTGLLEDAADQDHYRFFLADWDHIRLQVKPPADGGILANLYWDGAPFRQSAPAQPGQPLVLEGLFPSGDYQLALSPRTSSETEYSLTLERLDRHACTGDCEPNDDPAFATPVPPTLVVEGRVGEWRDEDWWALPVLERESEVVLTPDERRDLALVADLDLGRRSIVEWDAAIEGYRGTVPAGKPAFLQVKAAAKPQYRVGIRFAQGPAAAPEPAPLPLAAAVELAAAEVAAYRPYGQTVAGRVTLTNRGGSPVEVALDATTSDRRWRADLERPRATVAPGGRETVGLTVHVPADAWAVAPVRVTVRATGAGGAHVAAHRDLEPSPEGTDVGSVRAWAVPASLRGGLNVALAPLGGRRVPDPTEKNPGSVPNLGDGFHFLFDGMNVENEGLTLRGGHGGLDVVPVTVELAGGEPVEVAGFGFNAFGPSLARHYARDVELQLSMDGVGFETVADVVLDPIPREQFTTLPEPRTARFARLVLDTNWEGRGEGQLGLGEWKVVARPGADPSGGRGWNLASPELGGHVVWARPTINLHWDNTVLTAEQDYQRVRLQSGQRLEWVVGFHHDRAAQIEHLEWVDSPKSRPELRIPSVALAVSIDSPVGPWIPLAEWELPAGGGSGELELERPVWARFVKFSTPVLQKPGHYEAPDTVRIWERATGGEYRSILGEWGYVSRQAIYEELHPLEIESALAAAGNDSRAKAAPLEIGGTVAGRVQLGTREQWYRIAVPAGQNTLVLHLGGEPTVRAEVHLESAAGEAIPLRRAVNASTPRQHVLEAVVEPGSTVYARVEEPERSVLFLWDTSASVAPYLPVIYNSLLVYAEDLVPGRDAANFLPFGTATPLLRDWYGEPYIVQTVLNEYPRRESSSSAEHTLHAAAKALAPRAGTKAIVMVTDALTPRFSEVWDAFAEVQPRVFALGVGAVDAKAQDLMQDWSRVNGGYYQHLLDEGELEVAFERAASLLREPAPYTLRVESDQRAAPGPGSLMVTTRGGGAAGGASAGAGEAAGAGAIELVLDASGSMLQRMGGKRRIEVAKEVLVHAVRERIAPATPVALRVFGHRQAGSCRTDLEVPLGPLDPAAVAARIQGIGAMNLAKTPIADSLARVESDLRGASGRKVVVLVTDGEETCDGDPEKVIQALRDKGIDLALNIVGFAIADAELEATFERWAELGGGRYFSARDPQGLSDALDEALRTPYAVYDRGGSVVAEGVVDGDRVELAAGVYRVVVATSPPTTFDRVEVPGEEEVQLDLAAAWR